LLKAFQFDGTTLVVSDVVDKNVGLASRNVESVQVTTSDTLNTYQVLWPKKLLFTRGAFQKIEERLTKE
jgi:large subunit ribosomal protein L4